MLNLVLAFIFLLQPKEFKYAICFSKIEPEKAKSFKLVIIDPDLYSSDEIKHFKELNITTIAYINIGEYETFRNFSIPDSLIIMENPNWKNHFFVKVNSDFWKHLILKERIPKIIMKNFDGFFIDMIDIVALYPEFKDSVIEIISEIRRQNPERIIIANNGWLVMDTLKYFADIFLIEGLFTGYNFKTKKYFTKSEEDYQEKVEVLKSLNKPVLTLDYAHKNDVKTRKLVKKLSLSFGFHPYVATIYLNEIEE